MNASQLQWPEATIGQADALPEASIGQADAWPGNPQRLSRGPDWPCIKLCGRLHALQPCTAHYDPAVTPQRSPFHPVSLTAAAPSRRPTGTLTAAPSFPTHQSQWTTHLSHMQC